MKKIILFVVCLIIISCKEEKKETVKDLKNEKKEKQQVLKNIKDPKTVFEYIEGGDKSYGVNIDASIENLVSVSNVSLFYEKESKKTFIIIQLKEGFNENLYDKYRLVVRTFPYSTEDLRPDTIKLGRDFDSWYSNLYNHSDGINDYLYAPIGSIDAFKKVRIQFLEKNKKRFTREPIEVNDLAAR